MMKVMKNLMRLKQLKATITIATIAIPTLNIKNSLILHQYVIK